MDVHQPKRSRLAEAPAYMQVSGRYDGRSASHKSRYAIYLAVRAQPALRPRHGKPNPITAPCASRKARKL
jgi:hypothetical protein